MKLIDFTNMYDLLDLEISEISFQNNSLFMYIRFNVDMEYMANGCRPDFDYYVTHKFIFHNQVKNYQCDKVQNVLDFKYEDDKLYLTLTDLSIIIDDCLVDIIPNVRGL